MGLTNDSNPIPTITYCCWCGICGAFIASPEQWKEHEHLDEAPSLDDWEYDDPRFSHYRYMSKPISYSGNTPCFGTI